MFRKKRMVVLVKVGNWQYEREFYFLFVLVFVFGLHIQVAI